MSVQNLQEISSQLQTVFQSLESPIGTIDTESPKILDQLDACVNNLKNRIDNIQKCQEVIDSIRTIPPQEPMTPEAYKQEPGVADYISLMKKDFKNIEKKKFDQQFTKEVKIIRNEKIYIFTKIYKVIKKYLNKGSEKKQIDKAVDAQVEAVIVNTVLQKNQKIQKNNTDLKTEKVAVTVDASTALETVKGMMNTEVTVMSAKIDDLTFEYAWNNSAQTTDQFEDAGLMQEKAKKNWKKQLDRLNPSRPSKTFSSSGTRRAPVVSKITAVEGVKEKQKVAKDTTSQRKTSQKKPSKSSHKQHRR